MLLAGLQRGDPTRGVFSMKNKVMTPDDAKKQAEVPHPGMMGDGTEEQNLGQRGNPSARIEKKEVDAAFRKKRPKHRPNGS